MEDEEEDDIYAPDEEGLPDAKPTAESGIAQNEVVTKAASGVVPEEEESGEEIEEDETDSDIDIITEKKEEPRKETVQPPRVNALKNSAPIRSPSSEPAPARRSSPAVKADPLGRETPSRTGASYPAVKTSTVDVDFQPIYEPTGKPIMEVDMDEDFPEDDKPWRRPGTDMTDYFNYGFDEFTWANYCLKQSSLRKEVSDSKKQMDDMQSFLNNGMSGMPALASVAPVMPPMPGMGDIPPEMQQMFGQMMAQGMDPSQMDPSTFMQMMSGGPGGQGGEPNQGFTGQGYAQQGHNQQQMGYGYGVGGANQAGRGRGRRW
ncbi:MAG: hypothetical protein Q9163_000533 [Psora crenata]